MKSGARSEGLRRRLKILQLFTDTDFNGESRRLPRNAVCTKAGFTGPSKRLKVSVS